jgi:hypothetical protein
MLIPQVVKMPDQVIFVMTPMAELSVVATIQMKNQYPAAPVQPTLLAVPALPAIIIRQLAPAWPAVLRQSALISTRYSGAFFTVRKR